MRCCFIDTVKAPTCVITVHVSVTSQLTGITPAWSFVAAKAVPFHEINAILSHM